MKEPIDDRLRRTYREWNYRWTIEPRHCDNNDCGNVVSWQRVLSKLNRHHAGKDRLWACSPNCAAKLDREAPAGPEDE
jgi:hypothetical protein